MHFISGYFWSRFFNYDTIVDSIFLTDTRKTETTIIHVKRHLYFTKNINPNTIISIKLKIKNHKGMRHIPTTYNLIRLN